MLSILNSNTVLRVNSNYQRLGFSSVASAFTAMMGGEEGSEPAVGLDISYELDSEGLPIYANGVKGIVPTPWEKWINLPIRPWDKYVRTAKLMIRVPTVLICPKFSKMPVKTLRATPKAIYERDGYRCQYTGVPLTNTTKSLDHVNPRANGGRDTWENLVACHKDVNFRKGSLTTREFGKAPLRRPVAPKPIPLCVLVKENKSEDHQWF